jgi:hypothetical protein
LIEAGASGGRLITRCISHRKAYFLGENYSCLLNFDMLSFDDDAAFAAGGLFAGGQRRSPIAADRPNTSINHWGDT